MKLALHDPAIWNQVSAFLDRAFDLPPAEREPWLLELSVTKPDIAVAIRELLDERERLNAEEFLLSSPFRPDEMGSLTGKRIGAYTVNRLLGRGGMGEVWLAERHDGRFEGRCAIKLLDAAIVRPELAGRFLREGKLLGRLLHPNIARLIDAGSTQGGRPYLALEYVDGERIDRYCRSRGISVRERVRLFLDVVSAVAHAHSNLIIHRDLKPSNVFVTADGTVKLLDFGIAKLLSSEQGDETHTRAEDSALTPEYAAPEQLLGEPPSTATDVYQLGILLFVILTGHHPLHKAGSRAERIEAALNSVVPRASECVSRAERRALRGDLDAILAKALRKDPRDRYATAAALQEDLSLHLEKEPVNARRGAAFYRTKKFMARHRWAVSSAAVLFLCLCATSIFAVQQAQIAQRQALLASRETAKATATNKFLVSVFSGAGIGTPTRKHPNEMTAVELLDSGSEQMFASLEQQPEAMLELIRAVGDIYTLMEDVDKSIALYRRGVKFSERIFGSNNPMKAELLIRIASDEAFAGRISAAAKDVLIAEEAVEAGGDHHARYYAELLRVKGNLLMLQGSSFGAEATQTLQSAIALYEERFADDPGYALSLSYLARVLMNLNEDDAAEKAAERAVLATDNPNTTITNRANAYSLRASVRRRLGKLQRAAEDYAAASAYFAQSVGTHHVLFLQNEGMRGELAQLLGKRDSGLAIIEATTDELSAIRPGTATHAIATRRLASAYLRDGSYDKALAAFEKAIEVIRPMHVPEALSQDLLGQAEAFIALGRLDEAERSADEAGELMPFKDGVRVPAVAHTQYVLGVIALARGDLETASRFAKRARDATQDSVRERVRLERIYALESQIALAHADAREALERTQAAVELLKADGAKSNLFVKTETLARHGVALCHVARTTEGAQLLTDQLSVLRRIRNPSGHPLDEFERELSRCNPASR